MAKVSTPEKTPKAAPYLSQLVCDQIATLEYDLPEYRHLSNGEIGALGIEALEGYVYGERLRYDTGGKRWDFKRETVLNAFLLTVRCSVGPIVLAEATIPLDRIAGKEGEEALIALVERLAVESVDVAKACRAQQQAMKTEAQIAAEMPPVEADAKTVAEDDAGAV